MVALYFGRRDFKWASSRACCVFGMAFHSMPRRAAAPGASATLCTSKAAASAPCDTRALSIPLQKAAPLPLLPAAEPSVGEDGPEGGDEVATAQSWGMMGTGLASCHTSSSSPLSP